jgi:periplasmic divalent cation tolerance protein
MMETGAAMIMTTVKDQKDAADMAGFLIGERLAACVQEIAIRSHYHWEGETKSEPEILLLIKTAEDRVDDAVAAIRRRHGYELPEILVTRFTGGLDAYLDWMRNETRHGGR